MSTIPERLEKLREKMQEKGIYRKVWRCWIEQMNCLLNIFFHSVAYGVFILCYQ